MYIYNIYIDRNRNHKLFLLYDDIQKRFSLREKAKSNYCEKVSYLGILARSSAPSVEMKSFSLYPPSVRWDVGVK